MRDEMKKGDLAFFYHSGEPSRESSGSSKSCVKDTPITPLSTRRIRTTIRRARAARRPWSMVDIQAIERLPRPVTLSEMRTKPELEGMPLLQEGKPAVGPEGRQRRMECGARTRETEPGPKGVGRDQPGSVTCGTRYSSLSYEPGSLQKSRGVFRPLGDDDTRQDPRGGTTRGNGPRDRTAAAWRRIKRVR